MAAKETRGQPSSQHHVRREADRADTMTMAGTYWPPLPDRVRARFIGDFGLAEKGSGCSEGGEHGSAIRWSWHFIHLDLLGEVAAGDSSNDLANFTECFLESLVRFLMLP